MSYRLCYHLPGYTQSFMFYITFKSIYQICMTVDDVLLTIALFSYSNPLRLEVFQSRISSLHIESTEFPDSKLNLLSAWLVVRHILTDFTVGITILIVEVKYTVWSSCGSNRGSTATSCRLCTAADCSF